MADLSPNINSTCKWFKYIDEKTEIGRVDQNQTKTEQTSKKTKENMIQQRVVHK